MVKLKLEFMVLNQLMAVAARGIKKQSFAERRYHHPSTSGEKNPSVGSSQTLRWGLELIQESSKVDSVEELVVPSPTMSKSQRTPNDSGSQARHDHDDGEKRPMKAKFMKHRAKRAGDDAEQDEDEEIEIHMWEKHGKLVMEAPWFKLEDHV